MRASRWFQQTIDHSKDRSITNIIAAFSQGIDMGMFVITDADGRRMIVTMSAQEFRTLINSAHSLLEDHTNANPTTTTHQPY